MRTFHCFIWLSGLGLLHASCSASESSGASTRGGAESGVPAEGGATDVLTDAFTPQDGGGSDAVGGPCTANSDCGPNGSSPADAATSGDSAPVHCVNPWDCESGQICGYLESAGCSAQGECLPTPTMGNGNCSNDGPFCACDGTDVETACQDDMPVGYLNKAVAHLGNCAQPSPSDAGVNDAGPTYCTADSGTCGSGQVCLYPLGAGCGVPGVCGDVSGTLDCSTDVVPACSCDGTNLEVPARNGTVPSCSWLLPAVPIAYYGLCTDAGGGPCVTDSDCAGEVCAYAISDSCAAKGQCVETTFGGGTENSVVGCGCDGSDVALGGTPSAPALYAPLPLLHFGTCLGWSGDAGPAACATTADCAANEVCGFAESDACNAQGNCYPIQATNGAGFAVCACDGTTTIGGSPAGLPFGYAPKPVRSLNPWPCGDAGASL